MKRSLSRFELRIVFAILLPVVAPVVASLLFIPELIQARFAELSHGEVKEQLDRFAVFHRDFFEAKKREYSATALALSRDPLVGTFLANSDMPSLEARLFQVLEDHPEIRAVRLERADGEALASASRPTVAPTSGRRPSFVPVGLGDAPSLSIDFMLSQEYFSQRARAEEVATLYDVSLRTFNQRFREKQLTYYTILAITALVALALGILLARGVTRRISALASGTERVARGELEFELPARGSDEIAELTHRFNRMLLELRDAQRRIIDLEKISGWQDFARRLAHEIKNPLTPIRLAVQELRRRAPRSEPSFERLVTEVSEVVEDETGRLARLVNEFSQFARLPDVDRRPEELNEFLRDFMKAYNGFDERVSLLLPSTSVRADIDRDQMRQVMHNLVMNGLQSSSEREVSMTIELGCTRRFAMISVSDDGPGIDEAEISKIFEPYYTTKPTGTGLGLAIVKKIVLQHEGQVSVAQHEPHGACFTVRLPLSTPMDG
ncbi:MAG: HAMP domain-containing protein [Myxococcales bacterium]|nr:HAMP domain-containing protein [Myxococcales bacterium]